MCSYHHWYIMSQNPLINSLSFVLNEVNIGANEFLANLSIAL